MNIDNLRCDFWMNHIALKHLQCMVSFTSFIIGPRPSLFDACPGQT